MKKTLFTSFLLFLTVQFMTAQIPSGYYTSSKGTQGRQLKTALHHIIKNHQVCSYSSLMDHFKQTDRRPDGKVWDMYSSTTNYSFNGRTIRYSGEGAGYNREHSFPKSWFGGKVTPMYTDLFHIYPTDGYINNRRWHYAFGETQGETYQSEGGWSKLGQSTIAGCNETVFEPNDEYKGDFARTYFYMATCYEDKIAGWKTLNGKADGEKVPMLNQTSYPAFEPWAVEMLLRWAKEDPVSDKETARNNAVYRIQENRNPFIDFPGLEQYIWGDKTDTAFDPDHYEGNTPTPDPEPQPVAAPVFTPQGGMVPAGTEITISCSTPQARITYRINQEAEKSAPSPVQLMVNEAMQVTAFASVGEKKSESVTARYTIQEEGTGDGETFLLITDMNQLTQSQTVLIVCPAENTAMSALNKDYRSAVNVHLAGGNSISAETNANGQPFAFVLQSENRTFTLQDPVTGRYLSLDNDNNKLHVAETAEGANAQWQITLEPDGTAIIQNEKMNHRSIQYNAGSPRFACYKNRTQESIALFGQLTASGITGIEQQACGTIRVYDLNGIFLQQGHTLKKAIEHLTPGIYIVNGHKLLIR